MVLIDLAKARQHSFFTAVSSSAAVKDSGSSVLFGEEVWDLNPIGSWACRVADGYNWQIVVVGSLVGLYVVFRKGYTGLWSIIFSLLHIPWGIEWYFYANDYIEESLLVLRGMGIQTSTSSATYWSSASTRFIPTTQIQDIVIHEAFKAFEVRFYLAIIVEGEPDVVVVFPVCTHFRSEYIQYVVLMLMTAESATETFNTRRSLERCSTMSL